MKRSKRKKLKNKKDENRIYEEPSLMVKIASVFPKGAIHNSRLQDIFFMLVLAAAFFILTIPLSQTINLSPDACGYLDVGRNLFTGHGPVISYNIMQYWTGKYYPFIPYIQCIYGIIAGGIYVLFSLKAVIGLNIFIASLCLALLYKIFRVSCGPFTSFFMAVIAGFSVQVLYTSIYPWTEALHLLMLLIVIHLSPCIKKHPFLWGILISLMFFVRVASIYNIPPLLAAFVLIYGYKKEMLKCYGWALAGFCSIVLVYQLACVVLYGKLYPEYLSIAKTYGMAIHYPGAYLLEQQPVLNMPEISIPFKVQMANFGRHLNEFILTLGALKYILPVALLGVFYDIVRKKINPVFIILFLQGITVMVGYAFNMAWVDETEYVRYSLIPYICLGGASLLALRSLCLAVSVRFFRKKHIWIFICLAIGIAFFTLRDYAGIRKYYRERYIQTVEKGIDERMMIYQWIKDHTPDDALIASDFLRDVILFERPFVAVPHGKALSTKNVIQFLKIYTPDYVFTLNPSFAAYLNETGWTKIIEKDVYSLFEKPGHQKNVGAIKNMDQ